MDDDILKTIQQLNIENIIWIIFIVISIFNIYDDELIKRYLLYNDKSSDILAKKNSIIIIIISLLIYLYFLYRNYNEFKKHNNESYRIRFLGSIFILLGTLCFLYFQLSSNITTESVSEL